MTNERINGQWRLKSRPVGMVKTTDFEYVEVPVAPLGAGEVLIRNLYLSFDPAQRGRLNDVKSYAPPQPIGEVMGAFAAGEVVESNNDAWAVGSRVVGGLGWQQYATVADGSPVMQSLRPVPDGVPPQLALGALGGTGLTAYFGLLETGEFKAGDVVLVSGAAGATGSVVGQIARIKGARKVIGIAGGADKCAWLTNDLGFDAAIDYRNEDVAARLREECGDAIDLYFDNVGGEILDAALMNMALNGRIAVCGGISQYNEAAPQSGPKNYLQLIVRRLTMRGFLVSDFLARAPQAISELAGWIAAGELKHTEDIQKGIENVPQTFLRLFEGKNRGKQLLEL
ncbi:MAG TPA: NADP-dependent oxidoreductase [Pseudomonadales bacterium]|nr:NADP-dependent oxidoreductase [Pseudomonadales bacterium]